MTIIGSRRGIATVITTLKILVVVAVIGIAGLSFYNSQTMTFKQLVSSTFSTASNRVPESLVIENAIYHPSTQQFNFTFTNTGYIPVNVTKITISTATTPSFAVTATTSSTVPVSLITTPNSLSSTSEGITVPGAVILPGQAYTTVIPYHCFCDPITITVTTSRGTTIQKIVAPNVGWYDSNEQFRKRITINYNKVIGNPSPITLDNVQSNESSSSSNQIAISSFTINPGTNRLLMVGVESSSDVNTVSQITYAGMQLTKANATQNTVDSEIWYLTNPPAGKSSILVKMSGSANEIVGAYSFFGVDQTTPIGEGITNSSSSNTNVSTRFSTTYYQSWVVDSVAVNSSPTINANSGQTKGWGSIQSGTVSGGSSYQVITNPIVVKPGWSWNPNNQANADVAVEIRSSAFYNYPLVINATDTDLKNNALSNGNDIVFTSCDGMTKLNYELENFTKTTGNLQAWVQLPQLYWTPNPLVYMYYGNANAPYQQNVGGTWDSTYFGVWHFQQNPGNVITMDGNPLNSAGTTSTVGGHNQFTFANFPVHQGKNGLLLVQVQLGSGFTAANVTFNGIKLTQAVQKQSNSGTVDSEIWYLVNPPATTANIVVGTVSGVAPINVGAYSFWNIDQTNPIPTHSSEGGTSSSPVTLSLTTVYPNSFVIDSFVVNTASNTLTTNNAGQNLGYSVNQGTISAGSSWQSTTIPGSITTGWQSWSGPQKQALVQVELKAPPVITDSTQNHNDFTASNFASTDQINGELGYGLNFDGVNNYLSRVTGLTGPPNTNAPQTASIWFWIPTSDRGNFAQDIFTLETSGGGSAVQMGYRSSTTFDMWKYGGTVILTTSVPSAGTWHNAVYTYDGNGIGQGKTHRLYIDGSLATTSTSAPQTGTSGELFVGSYNCQSCELLNGYLDEFEYSNIVRSASWIATLYNNQAQPSTFATIQPTVESILTPRFLN